MALHSAGIKGLDETKEPHCALTTCRILQYRLVQKTALKLLLVFVEYAESNCELLVEAIEAVDRNNREKPWSNVMKILCEKDANDPELLVFTMTLINMVCSSDLIINEAYSDRAFFFRTQTVQGIPDQDSFYDVVDSLEQLGMMDACEALRKRKTSDAELIQQVDIYDVRSSQKRKY